MFASKRKGLFVAWIDPKAADVMLTGVTMTPDPQALTLQNFALKLMFSVEDAGVEYTPFEGMRSVLFNDSHCIGYPIRQDIKFWSLVVLAFTVTGVTLVQLQKPLS